MTNDLVIYLFCKRCCSPMKMIERPLFLLFLLHEAFFLFPHTHVPRAMFVRPGHTHKFGFLWKKTRWTVFRVNFIALVLNCTSWNKWAKYPRFKPWRWSIEFGEKMANCELLLPRARINEPDLVELMRGNTWSVPIFSRDHTNEVFDVSKQ